MERPTRANHLESDSPLPCPMDYLDYRQFMRDRVGALSRQDKKFSQNWIAKKAGFKSPQLLSMIVSGQRSLGPERIPDLGKALKLTEQEARYFRLIVDLAQAATPKNRQDTLERIRVEFQNGFFRDIPDEGLEILRDWYLPALRELVSLKSFRADPEWIADRLGITPAEAQSGLSLLIKCGFLTINEQGGIVRAEPSVHTPDKIYPMMIGQFHLQMLERSFRAHGLSRDKRYFECLTFALSRKNFPQVVDAVKRFFREIDMLVESQIDDREDVCQMNLQLFPLTPWMPTSEISK